MGNNYTHPNRPRGRTKYYKPSRKLYDFEHETNPDGTITTYLVKKEKAAPSPEDSPRDSPADSSPSPVLHNLNESDDIVMEDVDCQAQLPNADHGQDLATTQTNPMTFTGEVQRPVTGEKRSRDGEENTEKLAKKQRLSLKGCFMAVLMTFGQDPAIYSVNTAMDYT